jgi:hypothetical protein
MNEQQVQELRAAFKARDIDINVDGTFLIFERDYHFLVVASGIKHDIVRRYKAEETLEVYIEELVDPEFLLLN